MVAGGFLAVLGGLFVAFATHGLGFARNPGEGPFMLVTGSAVLTVGLVAVWAGWRRPVMLRVGPKGLHPTLGYAGPIPWSEIGDISQSEWRAGPFRRASVLVAHLTPLAEVPVRWRLPALAAVDRWGARKMGVRVQLQHLDAPDETILASVERFHEVKRSKRE